MMDFPQLDDHENRRFQKLAGIQAERNNHNTPNVSDYLVALGDASANGLLCGVAISHICQVIAYEIRKAAK